MDAKMNILSGDKGSKFVSWLSIASKFLPKSMSIEEASHIFLRRCKDEEKEQIVHEKKQA